MIGEVIKEKRKQLGLSQFEFALIVGTSQSAVYCWENNVKTPSLKTVMKLASIFNCTIDELCGREVKINE